MANQNRVIYTVDPSTNPASWPPGQAPEFGTAIYRVDVTYINLNGDSDFRTLRTGTNRHIHHAVIQVTKHIARGLYRILSMNVGEYQCVVVMETEKSTDDLMSHGFPWDRDDDTQPNVILE
ncbi:hypothetical protein RAB80_002118 [Fusarium oxysporum f. sp. vasinfectum]|uniref:Uncharacterized protein n=2 Tax=Fusarium oxysporum TaxID=5507 RepID=X0KYS4_FUSOX|nr:hypothetical protein FOMG_02364 [Fusarium oxysporum f. sp. melonis 26406]EXM13811.1 hypothetical protein FOTG_17747 [Fusarium oxysporum f. sp. vasinfectum 25433]KAK2684172.1 hypothetical protein RAB80_002118 [Fusarium oxysporum f. sp. vasinfectum]KAK2690246.1 hypothetical protein QWA68_010872 [Fusarium oxysporum]KAK2936790.1 hypothetical protein FoTM2_000005 [Fusarium oxysporum f. sp. vasinfectum]